MSRNPRFSLWAKSAKRLLCLVWVYFAVRAFARDFFFRPIDAKFVKFLAKLYKLSRFLIKNGKLDRFSGILNDFFLARMIIRWYFK